MEHKDYVCILADCKDAIRDLIAKGQQVDAIVTDPPYELGFMNKGWDKTGIANDVELWKLCLEILKPGGHLLAFGGSRTYHRMASAIEDAGFEIRDQIMWIYGSGFPKSLNVGKAMDKMAGAEREVVGMIKSQQNIKGPQKFGSDECKFRDRIDCLITAPSTDAAKQWDGWGSALKPAHEPIVMARKPLSEKNIASNILKHGTGGINVGGCKVGNDIRINEKKSYLGATGTFCAQGLIPKSTGRVEVSGRFPANFIHDGSEEVEAEFAKYGESKSSDSVRKNVQDGEFKSVSKGKETPHYTYGHSDKGTASRFFYCAKASSAERNMGCEGLKEHEQYNESLPCPTRDIRKEKLIKNHHPTVKPIKLMKYLCRLITPPNGIILDPFMGSGSTGIAAKQEGFRFIGIEREQQYLDIAIRRIDNN